MFSRQPFAISRCFPCHLCGDSTGPTGALKTHIYWKQCRFFSYCAGTTKRARKDTLLVEVSGGSMEKCELIVLLWQGQERPRGEEAGAWEAGRAHRGHLQESGDMLKLSS